MNNYWDCHPQSVRLKYDYSDQQKETAKEELQEKRASVSMESCCLQCILDVI